MSALPAPTRYLSPGGESLSRRFGGSFLQTGGGDGEDAGEWTVLDAAVRNGARKSEAANATIVGVGYSKEG